MPLKEEFRQQGDFLFRHRGILPIIILIPALWLTYHNQHIDQKYYFIFFIVSLFGLFIRCITIGIVAENTSGRNTSEGQIADTVNTKGIYSIVRHPLYFGNFFMWLGLALCTYNIYFIFIFMLLYWIYYERIMYAEEEFLRDKFGKEYEAWAEKTPAFIPDFSKWSSEMNSFNWKKVLRQEKSGFLLMCIIYYLFYCASLKSIKCDAHIGFCFIACLGIVIYLSVKIIEKTTDVLK